MCIRDRLSAEQIEAGNEMLYHPHHLVDHRAAHWHQLWTSKEVRGRGEVLELFDTIHTRARLEPLDPLDVDDLRMG
eukprot:8255235-Pyramimonas_sp.AAC.1